MKSIALNKKDVLIASICVVFLLLNFAAIGSSGRRRAKQAICLSNLLQWGKYFSMWANDNNGYFWSSIKVTPDGVTGWSHQDWVTLLAPYHDYDPRFRTCPEAAEPRNQENPELRMGSTFHAWYRFMVGSEEAEKVSDFRDRAIGSYGCNAWIQNPDRRSEWSRPHNRYWRTINVANGKQIPLLLDSICAAVGPHHTDRPPEIPYYFEEANGAMQAFCINRHNEKVNGVFLDGSARAIGLKELWRLKWHREFDVNASSPTWPDWMKDFKDY